MLSGGKAENFDYFCIVFRKKYKTFDAHSSVKLPHERERADNKYPMECALQAQTSP